MFNYSLLRTVVVEFVAMTLFIYVVCGTVISYAAKEDFDFSARAQRQFSFQIHTDTTFGTVVPLAFGLSITVLAYATAEFGAGHLNPAVTIALLVLRKVCLLKAVLMIIAQTCGSLLAVGLLTITIPNASDSGYGANMLSLQVSVGNAVAGEIVMTFMLVLVILKTTRVKNGDIFAPIAIGFTVFLAHTVLLAIDGCSINPARSFGPAVAADQWEDFWVFVVGPIVGGLLAALVFKVLTLKLDEKEEENESELDTPCKGGEQA
eukprot:TRINITY_DN5179_c0_g1_i1.p1 TRINITY_DN5179_c0_g1~~TRINITY_DN5179_c0_g1_i1.p1  ORF type:complete len:309 (-),score=25.16 TRINITY_DN5179_c0_g1_i1:3329-4117(-)